MGLLGRLFKRRPREQSEAPKTIRVPVPMRGYAAAKNDLHYSNWTVTIKSADEEIRAALRPVRARARDLAINDVYAKKFLSMCVTNIVGPDGVGLESKIMNRRNKLDKSANDKIEAAWRDFNKPENFSVTGTISGLDGQKLFIETTAREGECMVRLVRDRRFKHGIATQFIDVDHLDENLNMKLGSGNVIKMGREFDSWGKPVAYYLRTVDSENYPVLNGVAYREHKRVSAEEIIFGFIAERPAQSRAVSWLAPGMTNLKMLNGYREAEVVGARIAASKMGIMVAPEGEDYTGDDEDSEGNPIDEVEPGLVAQLPRGWDWKDFDPKHPSGNFEPFTKGILRGLASGWNVAYTSLASDITDVNFSSIRSGLLDERDNWKVKQVWFIQHYLQILFEAWLEMALLAGTVDLPTSNFEKFNKPTWKPKRWPWVDPYKDVMACEKAIANKLRTRTSFINEEGGEFEDVISTLAKEEKEIATALGGKDDAGADDSTED